MLWLAAEIVAAPSAKVLAAVPPCFGRVMVKGRCNTWRRHRSG